VGGNCPVSPLVGDVEGLNLKCGILTCMQNLASKIVRLFFGKCDKSLFELFGKAIQIYVFSWQIGSAIRWLGTYL